MNARPRGRRSTRDDGPLTAPSTLAGGGVRLVIVTCARCPQAYDRRHATYRGCSRRDGGFVTSDGGSRRGMVIGDARVAGGSGAVSDVLRPLALRNLRDRPLAMHVRGVNDPRGRRGMSHLGSSCQRRQKLIVAVLAAVVLAIAACGDDGLSGAAPPGTTSSTATETSDVSTSPPSSATTTPTTSGAAEDEAVLAAYRDFWAMFLELGGMTGPFDPNVVIPRLRERTTGREYEVLFNQFQADRLAGVVTRGDVELVPRVTSVDGAVATVSDCIDDTTGAYRAATGERLDSDDPQRRAVSVTLQLEEAQWKVAAIRDEGRGCTAS